MKDLLLLLSLLATMVCGFWLMDRLDRFLETKVQSQPTDEE